MGAGARHATSSAGARTGDVGPKRAGARPGPARAVARALLGGALGFGLALAGACYDDAVTLGFFCERDSDCGTGQTCENSICGSCGDDTVTPGELCFGASQDYGIPGDDIVAMFATGLDDDPSLDLVFVTNDTCDTLLIQGKCWRIHLLLNQGDGSFVKSSSSPDDAVGGWVDSFVPADVSGDGEADLVLGLKSIPALLVQLDVAGEGGPMANEPTSIDLPAPPRGVQVTDLDGDGDADIVVGSDAEADALTVFLNDGAGTFAAGLPVAAAGPARVGTPADLDGDGDVDLLTWGAGRLEVGLLAGGGDGTFSDLGVLPTAAGVADATTEDLDGDDDLDVVVALPELDRLQVFMGRGDGTFEPPVDLATLEGGRPESAATFDVNEDGLPDLAAANVASDKVTFFINRAGAFPDVVQLDVSAGPRQMVREDFNVDGVGDLVVANKSGTVSVLLSEF